MKENKKIRKPNQVVIEELIKFLRKKNIPIYSEKTFLEEDNKDENGK